MSIEKPVTLIGEWVQGISLLSKMGFTKDQIFEISEKASSLIEMMLRCYKPDNDNIISHSVQEWFEGIVYLKNKGFTYDEILYLLEDIDNVYFYYAEKEVYNDIWQLADDDEDDYEVDDDDDDDDDDNDDDDDDDDFDPRKFFPRK